MPSKRPQKSADAEFRVLFEQHPQAMWVLDSAGERFLEANAAALRLYGYSLKEFRALRVPDVAGAGGLGPHRTKDGKIIDVEMSRQPVDYAGSKAWLAMLTDVSERRTVEGQLRQARKMEEVGMLAGGVAHDFNNLLTIINGYTQMVLNTLRLDDANRLFLEQILRASEHAGVLTRQILTLSREPVSPKVIELNTLVNKLSGTLRRLIGDEIKLHLALGRDAGKISADPGHVELILMNLVVNARDAMPKGGTLTVETAAAELDGAAYVMLSVSNTGRGLDKATRERLFDSFLAPRRSGKGTGIGLATVAAIIQQSGGELRASSESGRGNTIEAYFPCVGQPQIQGNIDGHSSSGAPSNS